MTASSRPPTRRCLTFSSCLRVLLQVISTYWLPLIYLFLELSLVWLRKGYFGGDYPFDVSELILAIYRGYGPLVNEFSLGLLLLLFTLHPLIIAGLFSLYQYRRQQKHSPGQLTLARWSVRNYFAAILTFAYLINVIPTFSCRNALCDFLPVGATFPGVFAALPFVQMLDQTLTQHLADSYLVIDLLPLLALPNAALLYLGLLYYLTPHRLLPRFFRHKKRTLSLCLIILIICLIALYNYVGVVTFRFTSQSLREYLTDHLPENPLPGFKLQKGDIIIERPHGDNQDLVAQLSGTFLAHTQVYCGDGQIVSASGMDHANTGGIMVEDYTWQGRRINGALPTSIVLRRPGSAAHDNNRFCRELRRIADDDSYVFGLDLLGKRQHFNCTNIVLYSLGVDVPFNFNFITPDYLFVYLLDNGWQIVNWFN